VSLEDGWRTRRTFQTQPWMKLQVSEKNVRVTVDNSDKKYHYNSSR